MIQMYKILTELPNHHIQSECTICWRDQVWKLSGDNYGFLCISRAKVFLVVMFLTNHLFAVLPVEKLSQEWLGDIFNFYVLLSILIQLTLHIALLVYITDLCMKHKILTSLVVTLDIEAYNSRRPSLNWVSWTLPFTCLGCLSKCQLLR